MNRRAQLEAELKKRGLLNGKQHLSAPSLDDLAAEFLAEEAARQPPAAPGPNIQLSLPDGVDLRPLARFVKVPAPIVNVTVPKQDAQPAPVVTVNVPKQDAPVIHMATAPVKNDIHVPKGLAPVVHVHIDMTPVADAIKALTEALAARKLPTLKRDNTGRLIGFE